MERIELKYDFLVVPIGVPTERVFKVWLLDHDIGFSVEDKVYEVFNQVDFDVVYDAMPSFTPTNESPLQKQEGGSHYKDMKIQSMEYINANAIGYIEGTAIKYISMWKNKNGIEDLRKAIHSLEILIELEENK